MSTTILPSTLQPSAKPSIDGLVITIDVKNFFFSKLFLMIFEVTNTITSELSTDELTDMIATVIQQFDVSDSDISTDVQYIASGSLEISVDAETSENEVADAVASSIANVLDVHPRDVRIISVDLESGEVFYEIALPTYDEAVDIGSNIDAMQADEIEAEIQHLIPSAEVESFNVDDSVTLDVTIVVDGSEAGNIGQAKRNVAEILTNQGFEVMTNVAIVTSSPTVSPTFTTMMPSPAPSITGIVVTLTVESTDDLLNASELVALETKLADDYGVNIEDVTIEAEYAVSGSIELQNIPDDIGISELEEIVHQSISDAIGVHSRNVEVTIDPSSGEVTYVVTSDDNVIATDLQTALESVTFADDFTAEIASTLPSVIIASVDTDESIEMRLVVTIDATESTTDIEKANAEVISQLHEAGYSIESESTIYFGILLIQNYVMKFILHYSVAHS